MVCVVIVKFKKLPSADPPVPTAAEIADDICERLWAFFRASQHLGRSRMDQLSDIREEVYRWQAAKVREGES